MHQSFQTWARGSIHVPQWGSCDHLGPLELLLFLDILNQVLYYLSFVTIIDEARSRRPTPNYDVEGEYFILYYNNNKVELVGSWVLLLLSFFAYLSIRRYITGYSSIPFYSTYYNNYYYCGLLVIFL